MISVAVLTYRRAWSLPYCLDSLRKQTRSPDEVIVVLKPSGDGSEEIIENFSKTLNIRLFIQRAGNFTDALSMAINLSKGDLILFLDDDAIADERWIERYVKLFERMPDAGGITGIVYTAYKIGDRIVRTKRNFYELKPTGLRFHRQPLDIFQGYAEFISSSGLPGRLSTSGAVIRSALLGGVNMAWRREAVSGNDLSEAFRESRIGHVNECYLACYARLRGYHTYRVTDPKLAPIAWHIWHPSSLQRNLSYSEFWRSYDIAYFYWRLKRLGVNVSLIRYLFGLATLARKKTHLRIPALTYGFIKGLVYYKMA